MTAQTTTRDEPANPPTTGPPATGARQARGGSAQSPNRWCNNHRSTYGGPKAVARRAQGANAVRLDPVRKDRLRHSARLEARNSSQSQAAPPSTSESGTKLYRSPRIHSCACVEAIRGLSVLKITELLKATCRLLAWQARTQRSALPATCGWSALAASPHRSGEDGAASSQVRGPGTPDRRRTPSGPRHGARARDLKDRPGPRCDPARTPTPAPETRSPSPRVSAKIADPDGLGRVTRRGHRLGARQGVGGRGQAVSSGRPSSPSATSTRSAPATSGASNTAGNVPSSREAHPVTSPAR